MEQEEYLLTLQGGCEARFLAICRVLFDLWKGEAESLLMAFLSGLQRQKIVLPSAKRTGRVLSAVPLEQAPLGLVSPGSSKERKGARESLPRACPLRPVPSAR